MKKLLYEITVIDLPHNQWHPHRPWPLHLARAIQDLLTALLAGLLFTAIRIEYALHAVASSVLTTAEAVASAIRVVYAAGRVTIKVAWDDNKLIIDNLGFKVGRVIIGNQLEGCYA